MSGTQNTEATASRAATTQQDDPRDAWVKSVLGIETSGRYRDTPLSAKALPEKYDGEDTLSIGTQKGPLIGVQKGPRRIGLCR